MPIVLSGSGLTVERLVRIARDNEEVRLHPDVFAEVKVWLVKR